MSDEVGGECVGEEKPKPAVTLRLTFPKPFQVKLDQLGEVDAKFLSLRGSKELGEVLESGAAEPEVVRTYAGIVTRVPAGAAEQRSLTPEEISALSTGDLQRFARAYLGSKQSGRPIDVDESEAIARFVSAIRDDREGMRQQAAELRSTILKGVSTSTLDLIKESMTGADALKQMLGKFHVGVKEQEWWKQPRSVLDHIRDMDTAESVARIAALRDLETPRVGFPEYHIPEPEIIPPRYEVPEIDPDETTGGRAAIAAEQLAEVVGRLEKVVEAGAGHMATVSQAVLAMSLDFNRARSEDVEHLSESLRLARNSLGVAIALGAVSLVFAIASVVIDGRALSVARQSLALDQTALDESKAADAGDRLREAETLETMREIRNELRPKIEQPWQGAPWLFGEATATTPAPSNK